jgi:hypothetical protein
LKIGSVVDAELEPYKGATGIATTLNDTVFSTIAGAPAYVSKATHYVRNTSKYGLPDVDLKGHNAVQGSFHFTA